MILFYSFQMLDCIRIPGVGSFKRYNHSFHQSARWVADSHLGAKLHMCDPGQRDCTRRHWRTLSVFLFLSNTDDSSWISCLNRSSLSCEALPQLQLFMSACMVMQPFMGLWIRPRGLRGEWRVKKGGAGSTCSAERNHKTSL